MEIELRSPRDVKPYDQNPRVNDTAVDAVAESIRRFGFRQPIVVDPDGAIVCGHTRWKAALKLRLEQVPVHVARDLRPEQVRAYRIADNKTAEMADWNLDLLTSELAGLQGADLDWSLLGFDQDELSIGVRNEWHCRAIRCQSGQSPISHGNDNTVSPASPAASRRPSFPFPSSRPSTQPPIPVGARLFVGSHHTGKR